jgi:hypothetical protein
VLSAKLHTLLPAVQHTFTSQSQWVQALHLLPARDPYNQAKMHGHICSAATTSSHSIGCYTCTSLPGVCADVAAVVGAACQGAVLLWM